MADDLKLLRDYRGNRDPEAFAELVGHYSGIVYGTAARITGNAHDAEDVAQECFLSLARDSHTEPRLLSAWLHRLAANRALNLMRSKARRQRHERAAAEEKPTLSQAETGWEDVAPLVDEALNELPDDLRLPLILHFLHEQTQEEIGVQLSVDRATVSRRIDKGVGRLRASLRRRGVAVSAAALVALLGHNIAQAAPPGLVAATASTVVDTNAGKGAAALSVCGAVKVATVAALGVAALAGLGWLVVRPNTDPPVAGRPSAPTETQAASVPHRAKRYSGAPLIADDRVLFAANDLGWLNMRTYPYWLQVRLSPNGRFLLYHRPEDGARAEDAKASALVFRDLDSGEDRPAPLPSYPRGFATIHTRYNPYDPKGARVALTEIRGPRDTEIVLYELGKQSATRTGVKGSFCFGLFDHTGSQFIARGDRGIIQFDVQTSKRRELDSGWAALRYPHSVCPTAEVACFFGLEAPTEPTPPPEQKLGRDQRTEGEIPMPAPRRPKRRDALRLYNVRTGKLVASLPVHEKNSQLDDIASVWTPDGRFICYLDLVDAEEGQVQGTRVWDRTLGREHKFLPETAPVGSGPDGGMVFLVKLSDGDNRPVLYDAAANQSWVMGDPAMRLLHGAGEKIVYLHTTADGQRSVHVGSVVFSESDN